MIYIGIDTGSHTGLAVWDTQLKEFRFIGTLKIHQALDKVRQWASVASSEGTTLHVIAEDARQRKWYGQAGREQLQGAGSIKRDATIWEDFLSDEGIQFTMQAPHAGMTKMNKDYFARLTGWRGVTSEHARDAALLVYGR